MPSFRPKGYPPDGAQIPDRSPLCVAGSQFPVSADINENTAWIRRHIAEAARGGARIVHFCETALSGYVGFELAAIEDLDFAKLRRGMDAVRGEAAQHRIWVLLGSTHRLTGGHLPHNSVYVISDQGEVVDRYDKRFCTGLLDPEPELDLCSYTPGNHATTFEVDGYRCGVLICYDYRFPELYRDLRQRGVEIVFQSFHNARFDRETFEHGNIWKEIVPATMMCHAATNYFWISATNSSGQYSLWPTFFVRPDGRITGQLEVGEPGVLISRVDPRQDIWDAAGPWRDRAMEGVLHSGRLVDDPRSRDRRCY